MLLSINGINMPTPSEFKVGVQDISQAERVASGRIVIERIATKIKLEMKWNYLTPMQTKQILAATEHLTFEVGYLDPRTNSFTTKEFYVGDRVVPMYSYANGVAKYVDISFNFIEV